MMKMMRTGQTLATCPHRFPIAIPHRSYFIVFLNPAEERNKEIKKTQIRIHSAIQTTAEFFCKLQLFPSRKPLFHALETSR
jgi:hypothetical protein